MKGLAALQGAPLIGGESTVAGILASAAAAGYSNFAAPPVSEGGSLSASRAVLLSERVSKAAPLAGLALAGRNCPHPETAGAATRTDPAAADLIYAACFLGIAARLHEIGIETAAAAGAFQATLFDAAAVQWTFADAYVRWSQTRWMTYRAAWRADAGRAAPDAAARAKRDARALAAALVGAVRSLDAAAVPEALERALAAAAPDDPDDAARTGRGVEPGPAPAAGS